MISKNSNFTAAYNSIVFLNGCPGHISKDFKSIIIYVKRLFVTAIPVKIIIPKPLFYSICCVIGVIIVLPQVTGKVTVWYHYVFKCFSILYLIHNRLYNLYPCKHSIHIQKYLTAQLLIWQWQCYLQTKYKQCIHVYAKVVSILITLFVKAIPTVPKPSAHIYKFIMKFIALRNLCDYN